MKLHTLLLCCEVLMVEADFRASIGKSLRTHKRRAAESSAGALPSRVDCTSNFVYLAELKHLVGLCAWWAFKTWGKYNSAYTFTRRVESFARHCNLNEIPLTVLYIDDEGLPLGMASLRLNDGIRPDIGPWLGSVYVDPAVRARGIGTELVKEIERKARTLGYMKIYLLTYEDTLPDWYAGLGWKTIGKDVCHGNEVTVMELDLS